MSVLGNVVQSVLDVGAVALLPIMILLLGLGTTGICLDQQQFYPSFLA